MLIMPWLWIKRMRLRLRSSAISHREPRAKQHLRILEVKLCVICLSKLGLSRIAIVFALILASRAASADVLKIVVNDTIHPLVAERFDCAIQEARAHPCRRPPDRVEHSGRLHVFHGTHHSETARANVPTIIYVTPAGSDACSAGFFILEAADVAAMAPSTNTGAAHPVWGDGRTMDPVMKEKLENYAASLLRSYTGKRGRNVKWPRARFEGVQILHRG